ncbi:Uncharacterised protein [Burkholderia pseudomallei]|nr:Uncharacterised protein [Burkholderia pseudomallei]CAJ6706888.1 Uncharacterised protein [Burkholderia pseudomallei]
MNVLVPPEFKSQTPELLRRYAQQFGDELSPDVLQAMLDAASELEGSEEAFAAVVDEKRDLQRKLAQTESNLRGAYDTIARQNVQLGKQEHERHHRISTAKQDES